MKMINSPVARQTEMSVIDIYRLNTEVQMDSQRFINKYTNEDIDEFFKNLVAGNLHQNIILIDNKKAFKRELGLILCNSAYSVVDGQHRIEFIRKIIGGAIPVEGKYWKDFSQGMKDVVTNMKLPVRIIEKIEWNDRGEVFVANNSGNPVSKQDLLTMQNTAFGNFIVGQASQCSIILSGLYGPQNHQRRWDKALRINSQVLFGNIKKKDCYDYGYASALEFYKSVKLTETDLYWFKIMTEWMNLSLNTVPSSLKKRHASNGAYVLRAIKHLGWEINGSDSLFEIFQQYVDFEKKQWNKVIIVKNTAMPYSEVVGNVGSKYFKYRMVLFTEFVSTYVSEWKTNDWVF